MPAGRPRKTIQQIFPENWKELIIEMSMKGFTEAEIRTELCIKGSKFHTELWYSLQEREEEFSKTLKMAKVIRQAWWERQARENLGSKVFQTGLWYGCMKNMFGYKDKVEVKSDDTLKDQELEFSFLPTQKTESMQRFLNN